MIDKERRTVAMLLALVVLIIAAPSFMPEPPISDWCRHPGRAIMRSPMPEYYQGQVRRDMEHALRDGCFDGKKHTWAEIDALLKGY